MSSARCNLIDVVEKCMTPQAARYLSKRKWGGYSNPFALIDALLSGVDIPLRLICEEARTRKADTAASRNAYVIHAASLALHALYERMPTVHCVAHENAMTSLLRSPPSKWDTFVFQNSFAVKKLPSQDARLREFAKRSAEMVVRSPDVVHCTAAFASGSALCSLDRSLDHRGDPGYPLLRSGGTFRIGSGKFSPSEQGAYAYWTRSVGCYIDEADEGNVQVRINIEHERLLVCNCLQASHATHVTYSVAPSPMSKSSRDTYWETDIALFPEQRDAMHLMLDHEETSESCMVVSEAPLGSWGTLYCEARGMASAGGFLYAEMGFGKTVCAIALAMSGPGPTLVVATVNTARQWSQECQKFGAKAVAIMDVRDVRRLSYADITSSQIVVVAPALFSSPVYKTICRTSRLSNAAYEERARELQRSKFEAKDKEVPLEAVPFFRVIVDEALENLVPHPLWGCAGGRSGGVARFLLLGLPLEVRRWCLSAALPSCLSQMLPITAFLRIPFTGTLSSWKSVLDLVGPIRKASQLPISLRYATIECRFTKEEEVLYVAELAKGEGRVTRRLLELCTHPLTANGRASEAQQSIEDMKKKLSRSSVQWFELANLALRCSELAGDVDECRDAAQVIRSCKGKIDDDIQKIVHDARISCESLRRYRKTCVAKSEAAKTQLDFLTRALENMNDTECPVCYDDQSATDGTSSVLQCGHIFHGDCIRGKMCPMCRTPITFPPTPLFVNSSTIEFSSKIESVQRRARDLAESGHGVVIFSQWDTVAAKVAKDLEFDTALCVKGGARRRACTLSRQGKIIVFSAESPPSGLNLTRMCHVIIVHPFIGRDAKECERQAIGRVFRHGQTRDVCVHYAYVRGTVEETIVREKIETLQSR